MNRSIVVTALAPLQEMIYHFPIRSTFYYRQTAAPMNKVPYWLLFLNYCLTSKEFKSMFMSTDTFKCFCVPSSFVQVWFTALKSKSVEQNPIRVTRVQMELCRCWFDGTWGVQQRNLSVPRQQSRLHRNSFLHQYKSLAHSTYGKSTNSVCLFWLISENQLYSTNGTLISRHPCTE